MRPDVALYTPDDAPPKRAALTLHLPPSTAGVVWHGASFAQHPRTLLCRAHMYPVTDGQLDEAHETPPILRFCFLELGGAWHAFDAFEPGAGPPELELSAAQAAELRARADAVVATAGQVRAMSRHKSANAIHARLYFNNIERGSHPPPEAMHYERMIHAAVQPRAPAPLGAEEAAPDEDSIEAAVSPGALGLMTSLAEFTKSLVAVLVTLSCLLLRCLSRLHAGADGTWTTMMGQIARCALSIIVKLAGTHLANMVVSATGAWVRRALRYAFPVYEVISRTSSTPLDAARCFVKLLMPYVVAWLVPVLGVVSAVPVFGDVPTLLLRITDELIGVSAMSARNRKLCERIDLGRRILSSVGDLVDFLWGKLLERLLALAWAAVAGASATFAEILALMPLADKPVLSSADVVRIHKAVMTLVAALGITVPEVGEWASFARTLLVLAVFAALLAIKRSVGNSRFGITPRAVSAAVQAARASDRALYSSCSSFWTWRNSCIAGIDAGIDAAEREREERLRREQEGRARETKRMRIEDAAKRAAAAAKKEEERLQLEADEKAGQEQERLAREAEEQRLARETEQKAGHEQERLAREAEERRLAREKKETAGQEEQRLAREAEAAAEEQRLARETEEKAGQEKERLAREAEEQRLAREAEEQRLARETEEKTRQEAAAAAKKHADAAAKPSESALFAESFLYAYATLVAAHYAPLLRTDLIACVSCTPGAEDAAAPDEAARAESPAFVAPVELRTGRGDAIDANASRGMVITRERGFRVEPTPYAVRGGTETGVVVYVGANARQWKRGLLDELRQRVALPLDFVIALAAPAAEGASLVISELVSNEAPVLVPHGASIRMVLAVGSLTIGSTAFDVWCRDTAHAWQPQLADADVVWQLAGTVPDAVQRLLRAAHRDRP